MMQRITLSLFLLALSISAFGQTSFNLNQIGRWDKDSLPVYSGISYNEVFGWVDPADNREYAILGTLNWTYFIEVTNPAAPVVRDSARGRGSNSIWRDFKTYGKYCYGVADAGTSSLQIFDMSYLPDSVKKVYDSNAHFVTAHNVFIDTATAHMYVLGANTRTNGVIVFDLAVNPENPPVVFNGSTGGYVHDCFVRNDTAYLNSGYLGLRIYDFTTPSSPVLIGTLPTYPAAGYNHSSWMVPGTDVLVMADETHGKALKNVDVSDPSSPSVISLMKSMMLAPADTNSIPHNPVCAGTYACISYYHEGVVLFDLRNPAAPVRCAWYDTWPNVNYSGYSGVWGVYPYLPSGHILGSDVNNGLYILRPTFPFPYDMGSTLAPDDVTCSGASDGIITAVGSGGTAPYSYTWSTGDTTATVGGLAPGTYYVTITDRWGHPTVDSATIAEPSPLVVAGSTTPSGCGGAADGTATLVISGGTPTYDVTWSSGATGASISGLLPGDYIATVTDANGCIWTDTLTVGGIVGMPTIDAGSDTLFCEGLVSMSATDPSPGTGIWTVLSGAGFFSPPNSPTASVFAMAPGINTYLWTVTQGVCTWTDTVVVDVAMTSFTDAGTNDTVCGSTYTLSANDPSPASGSWSAAGLSFSSTSNPSAIVSGLTPGTHTLTWTTTDGACSVSDDVTLTVFFNPTAGFTWSPVGGTVSFSETATYETSWSWDFGDGGTSTSPNPTHTYATGGTYTVCLTATNPCSTAVHCESVTTETMFSGSTLSDGLVVYPNPSAGVFNISNAVDQVIRWECWSTNGQRLANGEWHNTNESIDLSNLASGMYLLRLETMQGSLNVPVGISR